MGADREPAAGGVCAACGADNPPGARFCRRCGAAQSGVAVRSVTRVTPVLQKWRLIKTSLTRKDVRRLLGEPLRVEPPVPTDAGGQERWSYEYEPVRASEQADDGACQRVRGEVFFAADGRVVSWVEPDWEALRPEAES